MCRKAKDIILTVLLISCSTVLYAQLPEKDSIATPQIVEDEPFILNPEVNKYIQFEGELFESSPKYLMEGSSYLSLDSSLPDIILDENGRLTLRPYTIYTKPYEDPIHGLPPSIFMKTELGPGGGPTVSSGVGFIYVFDAESLLRRIFWKSERAKRKNAKRVQSHKYY